MDYKEYLDEFNKGKMLEYSLLLAVLPQNRLSNLTQFWNAPNSKYVSLIHDILLKVKGLSFLSISHQNQLSSLLKCPRVFVNTL